MCPYFVIKSNITIRRDLQVLEEKEKIRIEEEANILQYTAGFIKRGDVIIIYFGSTCLKIAQNLRDKSDM